MRLPSYLGICPHCKARVALNAKTCAGCGRVLTPGEAEKAAAKQGLYGHNASPEPSDEASKGAAPGGTLTGD